MKNIFTKLIIITLWLLSSSYAVGQGTVDFTVENSSGDCGDTICVPITVAGFTNIIQVDGSLEWDSDILEYVGLQNISLPNFFPAANVNSVLAPEGKLGFVWFDATAISPVTIPPEGTLLEACFIVVGGSSNSVHSIAMTDNPTPIAVSEAGATPADPVLEMSYTTTPGGFSAMTGCTINSLACNALLNVSADLNCSAALTPDMGLEGGPYDYTNMIIVPSSLSSADLDESVVYTVTDNTTGNSCWGSILFEDKTPPVTVFKSEVTFGLLQPDCSGKLFAQTVDNGSYDNCGEITFSPTFYNLGVEDIGTNELEFTVCDESNNCNSGFVTVIVQSTNCPDLPVAHDQVNLMLDGNISIPVTPEMVLYKNWNPADFTITPTSVDTSDIGKQVVFEVADINGNSDVGILEVCNTNGAILECKKIIETLQVGGVGLVTTDQSCATIDTSCTQGGWLTSFSNTTNDLESISVDCEDAENPGGLVPDGYTIYLWTGNILVDSCLNVLQVLDAAGHCDNVGSTTLSCNANVLVSVDAFSCSATLTPQMILEGGPYNYNNMEVTPAVIPLGTATVEVRDIVNNNLCWTTVTAQDKTPPVVVTQQNIVVELSNPPANPNFQVKLYADQVNNGSYDGCTGISLSPDFWTFDCGDVGEQQIELLVCDDADGDGIPGNSALDNCNLGYATITVELNATVSITCPTDITVDCSDYEDVSVTGTASTIAGCTESLTYVDEGGYDENGDGLLQNSEKFNLACSKGQVERIWSVADVSCSQIITATGISEFDETNITWPPAIQNFECEVGEIILPAWEDTGCNLIGYSVTTLEVPVCNDAGSGFNKSINTYKVIDWCNYDPNDPSAGGIWTFDSVIQPIDNTPPAILQIPVDFVSFCDVGNVTLSAVAIDSCNVRSSILWTARLDINSNGIFDYEWNPKNTNSGEPVYFETPDNLVLGENQNRVVWSAEDECGNIGSVTSFFTHNSSEAQDFLAPVITCNTPSIAILENEQVEIFASDLATAFDNCTANNKLKFTFSAVSPPNQCDAFYNNAIDANWYDGSSWFYNSSTAVTSSNGPCPLNNQGEYSSGGYNSQGIFANYKGEIHRWHKAINTSSAIYKLDDATSFDAEGNGLVNLSINVSDEGGFTSSCTTTITLVNEECGIAEDDISWPIDIELGDVDLNVSIEPNDLVTQFGYTEIEVLPQFPLCAENTAIYAYSDQVFNISAGELKILRTWNVLDWLTANVFTHIQTITLGDESNFICDFLPNDTPVGDCASGHTLSDDVEWPADITIEDHRITPSELIAFSQIDAKNAAPVLKDAGEYLVTYDNYVGSLLPTSLIIDRVWTLTRPNFGNRIWSYTQQISVDFSDFKKRVTVNTNSNRAMEGVSLVDNILTNVQGIGLVDETAILDLAYDDTASNGVNIKDYILIQKHILELERLNNKQIEAADVDGDNKIDGIDLVELSKVILNIYNDFPQNEIWNFYTNPGELSELGIKASIVGIKTGDVDDTAILGNIEPEYKVAAADMNMDDVLMNRGQTYSVPVELSGSSSTVHGFELSFDIDESAIEILSVTTDVTSSVLSYNVSDGLLKILFSQALPFDLAMNNDNFLNLEISAKENTTLSRCLVYSEQNNSFVLNSELELLTLNGKVDVTLVSGLHDLDGQRISVYPNPASNLLLIEVPNARQDDLQLELFDISGRLVKQVRNTTRVNLSDLANGVYTYRLQLAGEAFYDKLIIQK